MAKQNAYLAKRAEYNRQRDLIIMAWSHQMAYAVNASHIRRQVDDELRKICGEDFPSWEERYECWDDKGI